MALGAGAANVLRLVIRQGMLLGMWGVACGLLGAVLLTRLMTSLLFGVTATDAPTFVLVPLLLMSIVAAASWLPAWRASRVAPGVALQHE